MNDKLITKLYHVLQATIEWLWWKFFSLGSEMPVRASSCGSTEDVQSQFKEVVIIGNGPSGITLSYLLSGNTPFYTGGSTDQFLDSRLQETTGEPLVLQDLEFLTDGLEGRSKNPVSLLFDALTHPDADMGVEKDSLLEWTRRTDFKVDHVVLGKGQPGGAWTAMEGDFLTVSFGNWMELPDFKMSDWRQNIVDGTDASGKRVSVSVVANYYRDYVRLKQLQDNFVSNSVVTSVKVVDKKASCGSMRSMASNKSVMARQEVEKKPSEDNAVFEHETMFLDEEYPPSGSSPSDEEILSSSVDSSVTPCSSQRSSQPSCSVDMVLDEVSGRDEELYGYMFDCSWDPIVNPTLFGSASYKNGASWSCSSYKQSWNNSCCKGINKNENCLYEVTGYTYSAEEGGVAEKTPFRYLTRNVVLAVGSYDQPNTLNVPGENLPFVLHSLNELETKISSKELTPDSDPIMVIGAGLSAADAILLAQQNEIAAYHVFRRGTDDPNMIFNKLPATIYPEYHEVHHMMKEGHAECYRPFPKHRLIEISPNGRVKMFGDDLCHEVRVSYVVVLIGASPNLDFLQDAMPLGIVPETPVGKNNPVDIDLYSHESISQPGLFAMGPLVGDNFVRFLQGGAFAIASHLMKQKAEQRL